MQVGENLMSEISKPESGWQFLLQLLLAVITFTVIVLAIIFVVNLFDNQGKYPVEYAHQLY